MATVTFFCADQAGSTAQLAFSPDGRPGQLRFRDPATGAKLAQPATTDDDIEAKACALAGRNLTRDEWRRFIGRDYRRTWRQWPEG
jgi:hypothetical protein